MYQSFRTRNLPSRRTNFKPGSNWIQTGISESNMGSLDVGSPSGYQDKGLLIELQFEVLQIVSSVRLCV